MLPIRVSLTRTTPTESLSSKRSASIPGTLRLARASTIHQATSKVEEPCRHASKQWHFVSRKTHRMFDNAPLIDGYPAALPSTDVPTTWGCGLIHMGKWYSHHSKEGFVIKDTFNSSWKTKFHGRQIPSRSQYSRRIDLGSEIN